MNQPILPQANKITSSIEADDIYIYIYIYICVCVCAVIFFLNYETLPS